MFVALSTGRKLYGVSLSHHLQAARVEAVAHGGQVIITAPAYQALVAVTHDLYNPLPLPDSLQEELGIECVYCHGPVHLRGLTEHVTLVEITPKGFSQRKFPPLRIEAPESEAAASNTEGEHGSASVDLSLPHADGIQDNWIAGLTPEHKIAYLMKMCMRDAGVHKCDGTLLESTWGIYLSLKAILALHSGAERKKILHNLMKTWHLSAPIIDPEVLHDIGGENTPILLVLSTRAATVVLAEKNPRLMTGSSRKITEDLPGSVLANSFFAFTQNSAQFFPAFQHTLSQPARLTATPDELEETSPEATT